MLLSLFAPSFEAPTAARLCSQRDPLDVWDALTHARDQFAVYLRSKLAREREEGSPDAKVSAARGARMTHVPASSIDCRAVILFAQDVVELLDGSQIKMLTAAGEAATTQRAFSTAAAWIKDSFDRAHAMG